MFFIGWLRVASAKVGFAAACLKACRVTADANVGDELSAMFSKSYPAR
jgi:hypothetical protein